MRHFASNALSAGAPHRIGVLLAGAGGTGSQVLNGLARMDHALRALDRPGLFVVVADGDRVSASNVGRQAFSPGDVGQSKAAVLVTRVNRFFGLDWEALAKPVGPTKPEAVSWLRPGLLDVVIGCVDSGRARKGIGRALKGWLKDASYWLDFGNSRSTGQVILGTNGKVETLARSVTVAEFEDACEGREIAAQELPTVLDLFPDLEAQDDEAEPSCGMAEALARQDLYMNATLADFGLSLLWRLVHQGSIEHHGLFLNLEQCLATPLRIDPEAWRRMGGWEG
jgi:PRTRC genetic system ThiF family protein